MRPAWVPERARYDPKSFDLTDLVLDPDTKPAQPLVILLFLFRQFAAFGLLIRIIDGLVFRVVALIRAVAIRPRALGQPGTRAADGEVMAAAGLRWRNAGDPAFPRHDILGFQRVALFLAGVMPLLSRIIAGPVDGLLRAVDDQSLSLFPADPGFALHPEQWLRQLFDTLDRPANRAFVHVVEKADELLGDVTPVVDQHDQQVIFQPAGLPGAAGFRFAGLDFVPRAAQLDHHLVEGGRADAGQALKAGASQ